MIESVLVNYTAADNSRITTTLSPAFISNCIKTPPSYMKSFKQKKAYMHLSYFKRIKKHAESYVEDMGGTLPKISII